jgi:hypothetical protein
MIPMRERDFGQQLSSFGYSEGTFAKVSGIVEDLYEFVRCQRPSGKIYGTRLRCKPPSVELGAKDAIARKTSSTGENDAKKRIRIGKNVQSMSVEDLETLLKDSRVKPHQAVKLRKLIDEKKSSEPSSKTTVKLKAKTQTSVEKSGDPKKDAEREKYNELKETARKVNEISARLKSEIEKETGRVVTPTSPNWKEYTKRLKGEKLTTSKITDLNVAVREYRKEKGREWLDKELQAADIAKNNADWKSLSREERRAAIQNQIERRAKKERSLSELTQEIKDWEGFLKRGPELNTPDNRTAMIAMRALRAKLFLESKAEREAKREAFQKFVEDSPKYKKVPGSSKPIRKMSTEEIAKELRKAEKDFVARAQDFDKKGKSFEAGLERQRAVDASRSADQFERGFSTNPPLELLYKMQGYNARPEVVPSRKDLEDRKDLVKGRDGKALILWRGVTSVEFADQFKGAGPRGDVHYPGQGIYGNGTYAASHSPDTTNKRSALKEAESYAGWGDENKDRRMTAFGIRKDANIVQFKGRDWAERGQKYDTWKKETIKKAEEETGRVFHDIGEASSALGIHAYRVPQGREEDFWVILNRGALVVAADPQMEDY